MLYKHAGRGAVDDILPALLDSLSSDDADEAARALEVRWTTRVGAPLGEAVVDQIAPSDARDAVTMQGLRQITLVRSSIVFPILMEKLLVNMTPQKAKGTRRCLLRCCGGLAWLTAPRCATTAVTAELRSAGHPHSVRRPRAQPPPDDHLDQPDRAQLQLDRRGP